MYILKIVCTTFAALMCEQPPLTHPFKSESDCERALLVIVHQWKPKTGEYTFNCVRNI